MTRELPCGKAWIEPEDIKAVGEALKGDPLGTPSPVERFEGEFAELVGARHAVAVSSGAAGLQLAVLACSPEGGGRWITTPNAFVSTMNATVNAGGTPVLVDIHPETFLIDQAQVAAALERCQGKAVVAGVLPVHFAGLPVQMEAIARVARPHGVRVIEDAGLGLGAIWEDTRGQGHTVGDCAFSDATVFALDPLRPGSGSEGGLITTQDGDLARRLRELRDHGLVHDGGSLPHAPGPWYYEVRELGFDARMTDLQAALGRSRLARLGDEVQRKRELALAYDRALEGLDGVTLQRQPKYAISSYALYVVRIDFAKFSRTRRALVESLREKGIRAEVHFVPVHLQPYYQKRFGFTDGQFPMAEQYYEEALSLPLFAQMTPKDVTRVVDAVRAILLD
jgi:dTDP-4-amino-4,6-dideoxygalactose transaminase